MEDNNFNAYQYNQGTYVDGQKKESKALAVVGLVLSILAFICCLCYCLSIPFGIAAIIIAIIVLVKKKPGKGMGIASIILSALALLTSIGIIAAAVPMQDAFMNFYADLPEIVENYEEDGSVPEYMEELKEKYPEYVDAFMQGVIEEYEKDPETYQQAADEIKKSLE